MIQYPLSIALISEKVEWCCPTMCLKCGSAVKAEILFKIGSRITACIASLTDS